MEKRQKILQENEQSILEWREKIQQQQASFDGLMESVQGEEYSVRANGGVGGQTNTAVSMHDAPGRASVLFRSDDDSSNLWSESEH